MHGVTIYMALWALTLKPQMLADLLAAGDDLPPDRQRQIRDCQTGAHQISEHPC
jgi:hypothetical protein